MVLPGCMHPALYTVLTFSLQLDSASKVPIRSLSLEAQLAWHATSQDLSIGWRNCINLNEMEHGNIST